MKCPKCQADNPETRKFCRECGAKLLVICSQCGSENLPGDKFCGECGHNLTIASDSTPKDLSFDDKLDKIQRYLPKGLTEKILSQRDKIEGERKQVPYIREKHREASPDVLKWESIGSLSNCSACHTTAEKGLYEDGYVVIPR